MRKGFIMTALVASACSSKSSAPPAAGSSAGSSVGSSGGSSAGPTGRPAPGQPGHGSALVGVMAGSDMPPCVPDGVRLPKDFPNTLPVPDGARALSSQPWSSAGTIVRFATHGSVDDVWTFYNKELAGKGFVIGKTDRTRGVPQLAWSHDSLQGFVAIGALVGCPEALEVQIGYGPVEPAKK